MNKLGGLISLVILFVGFLLIIVLGGDKRQPIIETSQEAEPIIGVEIIQENVFVWADKMVIDEVNKKTYFTKLNIRNNNGLQVFADQGVMIGDVISLRGNVEFDDGYDYYSCESADLNIKTLQISKISGTIRMGVKQ